MEAEDGEEEFRRGWLRWLGVGTGSLALILLALWTQRAPIAENFIGREMNRRGLQASYDLKEIGLRTQRIENIVLGDPANPDLTARWVEVDIAFTALSPRVAAVRAGGVRLRGSYRDGVLRLGELDKFRDPASKAPFSLPDIKLALNDARLRLDTDAGVIGMQIEGKGNLRSGFKGRVAAAMPRATFAGCSVADSSALLDVAMVNERPHLSGPAQADAFGCRDSATAIAKPQVELDLWLGKALDRWNGHVVLAGEALKSNGVVLAKPSGRIEFNGNSAGTAGRARIDASALSMAGAVTGQSDIVGGWSIGKGGAQAQGRLSAHQVRLAGRDPLAGLKRSAAGTPVSPLAARLADAVRRAGNDNVLRSNIAFSQRGKGGGLVLTGTRFDARSGARIAVPGDGRITIGWPGNAGAAIDWALDGAVTTGGGGLPSGALRLARRPGGGFGGQLFVDPYAAGEAKLALEPVRFSAGPQGDTRFSTVVRLDGPLPDGRLRGLAVPVEGQMSANGAIAINRRCVPLSLEEARYGSFSVGRTRQTLCPIGGGALFATGPAGMQAGAEIRSLDLQGRSGQSPMRLSADRARIALGQEGFGLSRVELAIGEKESPVRLTAEALTGKSDAQGLNGRLTGAAGRIGNVPLIVENGAGQWSFARGTLTLAAAITVRDAQLPARFEPLQSPDFALTLRDGRIVATGSLRAPRNDALVARADIMHDLGSGKGNADLTVPGLVFGPALQPEDVTRLALGVVANVDATVTGQGHIRWDGTAVTSDGLFRTDNANLAAAFGPVEGLSGELRFTDLLGLVSAPGQEVRIKTVNPGVEVRDGVVRYRLEPGQKVRIEGGGWPFSGGQLVLLPTTMDFSADVDRYLTFRVIGLDAGAFIQTMELDNISATGTFDGLMPLIFNAQGGRVAGGVLVARQQGMAPLIMPEGVLPAIPCDPARQSGTLSYVGPVSNEQLGVMGRLAFDALKNLQYKCLTILMDGALDGEMVTNVVFNGVNRGKLGDVPEGMAQNLTGLPFIFNVRISAPFRGLLGTAKSLIDPSTLIQNSIGDQMQDKIREGIAVKPVESDTVPNREQK
ncbi:Exoprotein [Sphingobium herbicidovorans NBRC 16415]|uniref:Exoprotein n=1 Tax=Sphingobium herbicidovorans (strain ATCC 700291 / DSM 11019 / CCUG 56400 / KCTC 2939 / LMG 18315 / NBRC 16415 / MH) TaxID=1219045 RepID=A0A086P8A7_SPHHM|nr:YdbH domain-containing protein [Sphingobium herbicidovorans]KFG89625.1 Exoprotein [Sphingobium herbicidovorans NBRC 16415]